MNIRKLVLPTMIAVLMAAPAAFAQSADLDAQAQAQQAQTQAQQAQTQAGQAEAQAAVAEAEAAAAAQQATAADQGAQDRAEYDAEAAMQQPIEPEEEDERS